MPAPFPGFDPYLENDRYWRGFHLQFVTFATVALNAVLPPPFAASNEERITPIPDVAESYIEVLALGDDERVVTVIEVLSPSNKTREGYGRDAYVRKQQQLIRSDTHLLEIDFLREGQYTVAVPREAVDARQAGWNYLVCLHRGGLGFTYDFWPITVQSHLPRVWVPLTGGFPDAVLDLQACFERAYDAGPYRRRVDYRKEAVPPLHPDKAIWADQLLREKGLR